MSYAKNHPCLISANPQTNFNKNSIYPTIDGSAFIGPFSSVIGDVTIEKNVFIACNVTIRSDEGTPFFIGENSNLQDGVILHGLAKEKVLIDNKKYSIYIGKSVSCAHGSIIHGPCCLKDNVFVGFNSTIFYAIVGEGTYISPNVLIAGGIKIPPKKFIPFGAIIDTQEKADALIDIPKEKENFARDVIKTNSEFPSSYSQLLGSNCYNRISLSSSKLY